jgi:hypothetical protein
MALLMQLRALPARGAGQIVDDHRESPRISMMSSGQTRAQTPVLSLLGIDRDRHERPGAAARTRALVGRFAGSIPAHARIAEKIAEKRRGRRLGALRAPVV